MGRTDPLVVTASEAPPPVKKLTRFRDFEVRPLSGEVPFDVVVQGWLEREGILIGEPLWVGQGGWDIRIYVNGVLEKTVTSSLSPPGAFSWKRTITELGDYEIYAEFLGTKDFEGCQEDSEVGVFEW